MKNRLFQIISLLLCFSLVFPLSSCNKESKPGDGTDAPKFKLNSSYTLVRGQAYENSDEIIDAMTIIWEAIGAVYGEFPVLSNDFRRPGDTTSVNEYEILLGDTNREQSQKVLASLGVNDYTYKVESENVIVICGGSPSSTLEAAKEFCRDVLGYDTDTHKAGTENVSVSVGTECKYSHDYKYENAVINGVDIKDFVIAVDIDKDKAHGYNAARVFSELTGTVIPIVDYSGLSGNEKAVICIGASDRQGNTFSNLHVGYLVTSDTTDGLLTVSISATNYQLYAQAFTELKDNLSVTSNGADATVSLPQKQIYGTGYKTPTWTLKTENSKTLADGIVYTEHLYKDEKDLPYRVYILNVDPSKAYFYMGTYNDQYEYTAQQTTADHINKAVSNKVNVIAATNANFASLFHGAVIKEGVVLSISNNENQPYFGYTKDGRAVIGTNSAGIPTETLRTAVSGSHSLVENGYVKPLDMNDEFVYTTHPRTIIGLKEDGTVVLAVIDGRQPELSNGASLAKCAELMISFGCIDAINLDGGGSSNVTIKEGNKYVTKNSPSDGQLRKIPISLLIVGK